MALFMSLTVFVPKQAEAQYTYGPDYTNYTSGSYYYPQYSSGYFGSGQPYNATYYYPQFDPAYSQYYQTQYQYPYYNQYYQYPSYQYPYYNPNYPYYNDDYYDYDRPLRVSCYADRQVAQPDELVTWTAYATGGSNRYKYEWNGERMSSGDNDREVTVRYRTTGTKSPEVTVRSGNKKITRECTPLTVTNRGWWW
jgi:hypothetical protein